MAQAKSQKVATDDYTQMRIPKTQLASSSLHLLMPEQRLRKLKESINRMRERYKSLQSWTTCKSDGKTQVVAIAKRAKEQLKKARKSG